MRNTIKIVIFTFLIISIIGIDKLKAQDSCQVAVIEANRAFENGDYDKVILLVGKRINTCGYNKETKQQLYKILAASYSELDEIEKADQQTYKFIKKNPEYQTQSTDPDLFKKSLSNFYIRPRFAVGANFSIQKASNTILKQYQVLDYPGYNVKYSHKYYQIVDFTAQYYFSENFSLILDLGSTNIRTEKYVEYPDFYSLTYNESNFYAFVNVLFSYNLLKYKFASLSALTGTGNSILQPGTTNYTIGYSYANSGLNEIEGTLKNGRRELVPAYILGFSINIQFDRFTLKVQPRYSADLITRNLPEARYANPELNLYYYHIDDDYSLKHTELIIGASYNISYKVKHKYRKNYK